MTAITKDSKFYDNTILSSYKDCPRKYYLRHQKHWRIQGTATPLVFGLSWHAGMDVVWQFARKVNDQSQLADLAQAKFLDTWEEGGFPAQPNLEQLEKLGARTPGTAHEMYYKYIEARWLMLLEAEVLAVEQPFAVPIPGMDDKWYVGRLDKVINYQSQKLVIEHKTTSDYKREGGFRAGYVDSWASDSQVKGYQFGGGLYFEGLSAVWVDAALVHKKEHGHFRFIPVAHQLPTLQEWIGDMQNWVGRLEADTAKDYFPKNENSCVGKYGPCTFMGLCRSVPDRDIWAATEPYDGYVHEEWLPFDILKLEKLIEPQSAGQ